MPFYYFVKVPELPQEVRHQSGDVEVIEYLTKEGKSIKPGTPLVRVQNWWAVMEVDAVGPGFLSKTFFHRGARVRIGDPFAIIDCDGEDLPRDGRTAHVRVVKRLRSKGESTPR